MYLPLRQSGPVPTHTPPRSVDPVEAVLAETIATLPAEARSKVTSWLASIGDDYRHWLAFELRATPRARRKAILMLCAGAAGAYTVRDMIAQVARCADA